MHCINKGGSDDNQCAVEIIEGSSSGVSVNGGVGHLWSSSFSVLGNMATGGRHLPSDPPLAVGSCAPHSLLHGDDVYVPGQLANM